MDGAAKKLLAKEGYDPQFGARPLKRAVQDRILNPLSLRLLEGEFKPGDKIKVTTKDDELVFAKKWKNFNREIRGIRENYLTQRR